MAEMYEGRACQLNLICIDASKHSKRSLEWYFENHHHDGDDVGLVHVHVPPDLPPAFILETTQISVYHDLVNRSIDKSKRMVEEYKNICLEKEVTPKYFVQSMRDSIGHTICDIAKQNKANMIVIGQRGLGAIRRTFLGSVSDYIIHHTHVPVLLIPPEDK